MLFVSCARPYAELERQGEASDTGANFPHPINCPFCPRFPICLQVRAFIADFSNVFSILLFCGVDACFGLDTPKLHIPSIIKVWPHRWGLCLSAAPPSASQCFGGDVVVPFFLLGRKTRCLRAF